MLGILNDVMHTWST